VLTYLRPSLSDKDIPHRQTLCNKIINKASLSKAQLKELLKVRPSASFKRLNIQSDARMVLFTYDAWTSQVGDPYLSIT
ncbi:hypothetical protein L208DRAFT_1013498, partial [Tricholoma matsutake]